MVGSSPSGGAGLPRRFLQTRPPSEIVSGMVLARRADQPYLDLLEELQDEPSPRSEGLLDFADVEVELAEEDAQLAALLSPILGGSLAVTALRLDASIDRRIHDASAATAEEIEVKRRFVAYRDLMLRVAVSFCSRNGLPLLLR